MVITITDKNGTTTATIPASGVSGDYLPLSGGTMTGDVTIRKIYTSSGIHLSRTDTNASIALMAGYGSGHESGLYSWNAMDWMVYTDGTSTYLNGTATATKALVDTDGAALSVGSETQPVYFADGKPVATLDTGWLECTMYDRVSSGQAYYRIVGNMIQVYWESLTFGELSEQSFAIAAMTNPIFESKDPSDLHGLAFVSGKDPFTVSCVQSGVTTYDILASSGNFESGMTSRQFSMMGFLT